MRVIPVLASAVLACGFSMAAPLPDADTTFPALDLRVASTHDYTPAPPTSCATGRDLDKKDPDLEQPESFCPESFCNEPGIRCIRTSDTGPCCEYEITFDFTCQTGARPPGVCTTTEPKARENDLATRRASR